MNIALFVAALTCFISIAVTAWMEFRKRAVVNEFLLAGAVPVERTQRRDPVLDVGPPIGRVHVVIPFSFDDAQRIATRFGKSVPTILNLQHADRELSKRLIDFASGLTYALGGDIQLIGDNVFLLTPRNVHVSIEERIHVSESVGTIFPARQESVEKKSSRGTNFT